MILAMDFLIRSSSVALLIALSVPACGDDGGAEGSTSSASSSASDTATSGQPETGATSQDPGTNTAVSESTSSTGSTISVGESTTGEVALCNGWSERGPDMPWLELYDAYLAPMASGGPFPLVCGGQGSWMLPIFPTMGGWMLSDPAIAFSVEVVVEGFPGPFGSFYREPNYYYDLECSGGDTFDGGFSHDCIAVVPPDTISDLGELDGASATIHIELEVDGGEPLVLDLVDMTISAPPDVITSGCEFG